MSGTPPGASPTRAAGGQTQVVVNPAGHVERQSVHLPPGRHRILADLYLGGEVVAHAGKTMYVEIDPVQTDDGPPFAIEQVSGERNHPRWQFEKRSHDDWVLQYSPTYPLYRALTESPRRGGPKLTGVSAFVIDVCAEAIIEWALEPLDGGNSSRLDELLQGATPGVDPDRWENHREKM